MDIEPTDIEGAFILTPRRIEDNRGNFSEVWNQRVLESHGIHLNFVQDNQSFSAGAGTIRGLHCQLPPHAQTKLVRCVEGSVWDVAVDIRKGSPSFGVSVGVDLSAENGRQLLVPAGCLHGFATRVRNSVLLYKCDDYYAPDCERSVHFADPELNVDWGFLIENAILSEKDANAASFAEMDNTFVFGADL